MASTVVDLLIGKIASALENEAKLLGGLHDELDELKRELVRMKAFLEDTDKKNLQSEVEKNWVENVREMAHSIEDTLDEFMYHMSWQPEGGGRFGKFAQKTIRIPKNIREMHKTATKLQKNKKAIKAIPEMNQRYGVDHLESGSSSNDHNWPQNCRDAAFFAKQDELVGVKDESYSLKKWLTDEGVDQSIISVVGMGGSGKTTLVSKIYNDDDVKNNYECHAWITVSQSYAIDDLLRSLIKEFYKGKKEVVPEGLKSLSYRALVETLLSYLKTKRYLLVLDDVWDNNLWKQIRESLPHSSGGSRIVLTTRNEDVASFAFGIQSRILPIKPLVPEEAWSLFCMKAFSSHPDKTCPEGLKDLAKKFVEKCEGLPLAIATLGGLMYSKKSEAEWTKVWDSLNWQLSNNPELEAVKAILLLSFKDLSPLLKRCFLYCCLFPEDYPIRRKRLIKLRVAEGFVQCDDRITMDLAEDYLMELIRKSMLQVVMRNPYGRPKACKMHDLLRGLALSISEGEKFCAVYDGRSAFKECKARRLSVHFINGDLELGNGMSQLRSFLAFVYDCQSFPSGLLSKFKLMTVLDLEDAPIEELPNDLGILFNLTYLNLRSTLIAKLPESIGRLHKLQFLDIRDTQIKELPKSVANLENLIELIMYRYATDRTIFCYVKGTRVPFNISKLKKLTGLCTVDAEGDNVRQLGTMTQLTKIGISNLTKADGEELRSSIQKLKKLHSLFLMVRDEEESLGLDLITSPPPYLRVLSLAGKLERVPKWFRSLQSITHLYLQWGRLTEDVLPHIALLPNLGFLRLVMAFLRAKLHFSTGFAKLTSLYLGNLPELEEIIIDKGVMPDLKQLGIEKCLKLEILHGIEYLANLQEMVIPFGCNKLRESIEADSSKVQHIQYIFYSQLV